MPPGGIRSHDPSKRSALDRAATGIGHGSFLELKIVAKITCILYVIEELNKPIVL
jgi:hypothetical protein